MQASKGDTFSEALYMETALMQQPSHIHIYLHSAFPKLNLDHVRFEKLRGRVEEGHSIKAQGQPSSLRSAKVKVINQNSRFSRDLDVISHVSN